MDFNLKIDKDHNKNSFIKVINIRAVGFEQMSFKPNFDGKRTDFR